MSKVVRIILIISLITFCFGSFASASQYIGIATGSTGGTFYPVGVTVATVIEDAIGEEMGVRFSAHTSGGSADNLQMLRFNEIEMAVVGSVPTSEAYLGINDYEGQAIENVRFLTAIYPEVVQLIYREDSGIEIMDDFVGRTVAVGPPGGGGTFYLPTIFGVVGEFTFDDLNAQYLGYSDSVQAMQNNLISAAYLGSSYPTSAVSEIYASPVDVDMIEFSDEELEMIREEAPYYARIVIEEGTYPGQDRDLHLIGFKSALVTTDELDEDLAYRMMEAFYLERLDELKERQAALEPVELDEAIVGLTGAPLHPGAAKFYQDQGIELPDELIPPEMK